MSTHTHPSLMTPTWRGDLAQFVVLRQSMERFGCSELTHHVVVHTEDIDHFRPYESGGLVLHTTRDLLPEAIEHGRRRYMRLSQRLGRHGTRYARSANKRTGWFDWVRYAGWQIQQLVKIQSAIALDPRALIILDSDMIICGDPRFERFEDAGEPVMLSNPAPLTPNSPGLDYRWARTAHRLLGLPFEDGSSINDRLGTPYVLPNKVAAQLTSTLEHRHQTPWMTLLLEQPPASWSEFALCNAIAPQIDGQRIELASALDDGMVLHSDAHRQNAAALVRQAFESPDICFLRIQSGARDQSSWAEDHVDALITPYLSC